MNLTDLYGQVMDAAEGLEGTFSFSIHEGGNSVGYQAQLPMKAASTIKVPILIEAFHLHEQGLVDLSDSLQIHDSDKVPGAGVLQSMQQRTISLVDALSLMIVVSDNCATNLVIDHLGLERCQNDFKKWGLRQISLERKMMDYASREAGKENWISSEDLIQSLKLINESSFLNGQNQKWMINILENQQFRDKLPYFIHDDEIMVANKTGEIEGVENDCAIFTYMNRTLYCAVLTGGLRREDDGQRIIRHIGDKIANYLYSI
ncbi:serine hydrolase [Bacillus sp. 1P06AnD]|uniref:serine hydrolase n=1 Tax=Bacillus sp. 1P06AnD TaxID=3132208 RepID=UPI0039A08019